MCSIAASRVALGRAEEAYSLLNEPAALAEKLDSDTDRAKCHDVRARLLMARGE